MISRRLTISLFPLSSVDASFVLRIYCLSSHSHLYVSILDSDKKSDDVAMVQELATIVLIVARNLRDHYDFFP